MKYNLASDKNGGVENQYELLASAIVVQAVKDYKHYIKKQLETPNNSVVNGQVKLLEKFFNSQWFNALSDLNKDYLLSKIKKDAALEVENKNKNKN